MIVTGVCALKSVQLFTRFRAITHVNVVQLSIDQPRASLRNPIGHSAGNARLGYFADVFTYPERTRTASYC